MTMNTIGDVLRLNAKRFPTKKALIMDNDFITFFDLNQKANQLAHALISMGTRTGDKIALLAFNSIEWIVVFFAIAKIGAILVPINYRYKRDELVYVINNSESNTLIFGPEFTSLIEEAKQDFNTPPALISLFHGGDSPSLTTLMEDRPTTEPSVTVDPNWPFHLVYTSGTTGVPKGTLASHSSCLRCYIGMMTECDIKDNEVALANLPFFHVAGVHCIIQPVFLRGGTIVIMGAGFDPDQVLDTVARYRITQAHWVPTQVAMLVNSGVIDKYNISSLKKIQYGSSVMPPTVLQQAQQRIKADFYQTYGQTETFIVSILKPEDHYSERSQFTGREFFNAELRIVDHEGRDITIGEAGEIISRQSQDSGMIGYYKMEETTKETIRDGWIHTGDVARLEEDGYFTIVDRMKDVIISGAENIYPKEIENLISTHPAVKEVAVFGIPDDIWGESVCAAVVKNTNQEIDENGIIDFCASRLASYKKPKRIIFLDELPRNAFGKVTKNPLREPFWSGRKKRV